MFHCQACILFVSNVFIIDHVSTANCLFLCPSVQNCVFITISISVCFFFLSLFSINKVLITYEFEEFISVFVYSIWNTWLIENLYS